MTVELKVSETTATSQTLHFTVRDTGIGMDPATLERLFQPFEQGESNTNRRFGGTGLGLAISRRLADLMDGQIEVTSAVGLGTRITLVLRAELADERSQPAVLFTAAYPATPCLRRSWIAGSVARSC